MFAHCLAIDYYRVSSILQLFDCGSKSEMLWKFADRGRNRPQERMRSQRPLIDSRTVRRNIAAAGGTRLLPEVVHGSSLSESSVEAGLVMVIHRL